MATLTPSYEGRGQTDEGGVCLLVPIFTMKGRAEREKRQRKMVYQVRHTSISQSSLSMPFQSIYCMLTLPLSYSSLFPMLLHHHYPERKKSLPPE